MDREAWQATVHGFAKSRAQLSMLTVLSRTLQSYSVTQTVKNLLATQETLVQSLGGEDALEKEWLPPPVFSPVESHGQQSLAGYSPWGCKESDMTERLTLNSPFSILHM